MPAAEGRDADGILAAATDGTLGALLVGGVEPDDFADPDAVLAALDAAGFVVSLELRHSAVTERADVVFPIAPAAEKSGYLRQLGGPTPRLPGRAAAQPPRRTCGCSTPWPTSWASTWGCPTVAAARAELSALGAWDGTHAAAPDRRRCRGTETRCR